MSSMQAVVIGILWLLVLSLGGLVLILYRQIDRVTDRAPSDVAGSLLAGVTAPDIEILDGDHASTLRWSTDDELTLLAFVSTSCEACMLLLAALKEVDTPAIVLVQGETNRIFERHRDGLDLHWIAHAPDVVRDYGVNLVPLVYVVRGRTVLGSRSAANLEELNGLLAGAQEAEGALRREVSAAVAN